eukprot:7912344-Pyramimonas_sp.AAC.1
MSSTLAGSLCLRVSSTSASTSSRLRCTSRPFHGANAHLGGTRGRPDRRVYSVSTSAMRGPAISTTRSRRQLYRTCA